MKPPNNISKKPKVDTAINLAYSRETNITLKLLVKVHSYNSIRLLKNWRESAIIRIYHEIRNHAINCFTS